MATKKELEIQIEALRKFLTKQRARWDELNPQEQAHYEFVDERLHNLEQEKSPMDIFIPKENGMLYPLENKKGEKNKRINVPKQDIFQVEDGGNIHLLVPS